MARIVELPVYDESHDSDTVLSNIVYESFRVEVTPHEDCWSLDSQVYCIQYMDVLNN